MTAPPPPSPPQTPPVSLPSGRQVAVGSALAVVVAALAIVFFVLPAELGIDLTGFGEKTGLTGLARSGTSTNFYLERGLKRKNVLFPLGSAATPDEATLRATLSARGIAIPPNAKFAADHWDVVPDLMSVAKGITSGYIPLSASIASRRRHPVWGGAANCKARGRPLVASRADGEARIAPRCARRRWRRRGGRSHASNGGRSRSHAGSDLADRAAR